MVDSVIHVDWPAPEGVQCLVTTRGGGHSKSPYEGFNLAGHVGDDPRAVEQNRRDLQQFVDKEVAFQWLKQVHGKHVIEADSQSAGTVPAADATYCRQSGIACCVLTADCLPVCLASASGDEIGIAHAGWRGLAAGVLENTLRRFQTAPENIHAWLGPAIGPCHFEVGEDVRHAFSAELGETAILHAFRNAPAPDKWMADIYALAILRLRRAGVLSISGGGLCTYCDDKRFYSYRRQPVTGRFATLIRRL